MSIDSGIEWTDATWNPVTGCTKVSSGCKHCYAERLAHRLRAMGNRRYVRGFVVTLQPDQLTLPLDWRRPRRIFVNSSLNRKTLGLAFVDPEGFEAKFEMFEALAQRRMDVLFLFPNGIGVVRNFGTFARQAHSPMDELWGDHEWRDLLPAKLAAGKRITPEEANEKNVLVYHLLFFSKDAVGVKIWRGIKRIAPGGQRALL